MTEPQANAAAPGETPPAGKPPKKAPPPVIRMDRTRVYSTAHGERGPGDPWAQVHFMQNGLPFDAAGNLIHDHFSIKESPTLVKRVEKLAKEAMKRKQISPGDDDADEDGEPQSDEDDDAPALNLEAWARGEQDVLWQRVSDALTRRCGRRFTNKRDALEYMIAEGMVAMAGLSKANKAVLRD